MGFLSITEDGGLWAVANGRVRKAMDRKWILEAESLKNVFTGNLSRMGAREDHHGGVWLYDYGRGLSHIADDGQVRQFGPQEGFPGERVNCFFEDHEGNWWAGLDAGGLVRIRERRFQTIDTSGQVPTKPAKSVCEETNGTLWIGTVGWGVYGRLRKEPLPGDLALLVQVRIPLKVQMTYQRGGHRLAQAALGGEAM